MNAYRLKPLTFPWPPMLYVAAILAAYACNTIASLPAPGLAPYTAWTIGALLVTGAVSLDVWAVRTLIESHTAVMPYRCATRLVTTGPYRYSRNPIYLGYTLTTVGLGLILGNSWLFVAAVMAAGVVSAIAVRREELHLLARFGIEFERYCKQTRRWI